MAISPTPHPRHKSCTLVVSRFHILPFRVATFQDIYSTFLKMISFTKISGYSLEEYCIYGHVIGTFCI